MATDSPTGNERNRLRGERMRRSLGHYLRDARTSQKLSQDQLADLTRSGIWKVSRPTISSIERGEVLPNLGAFLSLTRALQLDPTELLEQADCAGPMPVDLTGLSLAELSRRAHARFWEGEFRKALGIYDAMLQRLALDSPDDPTERDRFTAGVQLRRAETLMRLGALPAARRAAESAVTLADGDAEVQSQAYLKLAALHVQMGHPPVALNFVEEGVRLSESCSETVRGRAWAHKGYILLNQEWFEEALQSFRQARDLLSRAGDTLNAASVNGNIGLCFKGLGKAREAIRWIARALKLARRHRLAEKEAIWLVELGRLALENGDPVKAGECALASARLARSKEYWLILFRAEWLRHRIAVHSDPGSPDRQRVALLRSLLRKIGNFVDDPDVRAFKESTGLSGGGSREQRS